MEPVVAMERGPSGPLSMATTGSVIRRSARRRYPDRRSVLAACRLVAGLWFDGAPWNAGADNTIPGFPLPFDREFVSEHKLFEPIPHHRVSQILFLFGRHNEMWVRVRL